MRKWKNHLANFTVTTWSACFTLAGRLASHPQEHWNSPGGQRIVVISPHPDDEAFGCAGTILLHKQNGDIVWAVTITDGSASRALGLNQQEIKDLRKMESQSCARILGIDHPIWLDLSESDWHAEELIDLLTPLLEEIQPDIIYAPSCIDFHPEHKKVALSLGTLFRSNLNGYQRMSIRIYQIHVPLTPLLTNLVSPVGPVMERVRTALKTYKTQSGSLAQTYRLRHYAGKFYGISPQVEEFWTKSPAEYARLHTPRGLCCSNYDFMGLLPHPILDPYIFIRGAIKRRQIANFSIITPS